MGQFIMRLPFSRPLLVCSVHVDMCDKVSIGGGVVMYGHHAQQEYGSPGSGCHSYSWSAGQEKTIFSCPRLQLRIWSREIGSSVPFHVSLLILHTQVESGAYSRDSSSFPRRYLVIYAANRHRISPEFISSQIAYRWRSMPRVRRHRARSRQGSSNDGCCLFRYCHGPINVRLSFPTPTNGM